MSHPFGMPGDTATGFDASCRYRSARCGDNTRRQLMRLISKGVLGATMALAAGSAAAQSSVTLYGVVDVFGQYLNSGAGTKSGPGSAYVPGAASFSERSGGSAGSQFGLK